LQIPRGIEWAYFDAYVSSVVGFDNWIAGFYDGFQPVPWDSRDRVPRPGRRVRVFGIKEESKTEKKEIRKETMKEIAHVVLARPNPADAHPVRAGGKSVPLQKMQLREQQPLSLKSVRKERFTEEDLRQRSERLRQAKSDLESRMNSEEFKKMRWVKLARKKGIPYFEDLPTLDPTPTLAIECEEVKLVTIRSPIYEHPDQMTLGRIGRKNTHGIWCQKKLPCSGTRLNYTAKGT
jgi:hypothetical protein